MLLATITGVKNVNQINLQLQNGYATAVIANRNVVKFIDAFRTEEMAELIGREAEIDINAHRIYAVTEKGMSKGIPCSFENVDFA